MSGAKLRTETKGVSCADQRCITTAMSRAWQWFADTVDGSESKSAGERSRLARMPAAENATPWSRLCSLALQRSQMHKITNTDTTALKRRLLIICAWVSTISAVLLRK